MRTGSSIPAILLSGDTAIDVAELECDDISVVFDPSHGNKLIDGTVRLLSS